VSSHHLGQFCRRIGPMKFCRDDVLIEPVALLAVIEKNRSWFVFHAGYYVRIGYRIRNSAL
jgi:hypothetical protein